MSQTDEANSKGTLLRLAPKIGFGESIGTLTQKQEFNALVGQMFRRLIAMGFYKKSGENIAVQITPAVSVLPTMPWHQAFFFPIPNT